MYWKGFDAAQQLEDCACSRSGGWVFGQRISRSGGLRWTPDSAINPIVWRFSKPKSKVIFGGPSQNDDQMFHIGAARISLWTTPGDIAYALRHPAPNTSDGSNDGKTAGASRYRDYVDLLQCQISTQLWHTSACRTLRRKRFSAAGLLLTHTPRRAFTDACPIHVCRAFDFFPLRHGNIREPMPDVESVSEAAAQAGGRVPTVEKAEAPKFNPGPATPESNQGRTPPPSHFEPDTVRISTLGAHEQPLREADYGSTSGIEIKEVEMESALPQPRLPVRVQLTICDEPYDDTNRRTTRRANIAERHAAHNVVKRMGRQSLNGRILVWFL
ncbi:hypothetical protein C8R43DRAFT_946893 [Mycena crocata]|nr:hypothetical protein C8R43DRAFT_946893 [Mycena crocata]